VPPRRSGCHDGSPKEWMVEKIRWSEFSGTRVIARMMLDVGSVEHRVCSSLRDWSMAQLPFWKVARPFSKWSTSHASVNCCSNVWIICESGASGTEVFVTAPRRICIWVSRATWAWYQHQLEQKIEQKIWVSYFKSSHIFRNIFPLQVVDVLLDFFGSLWWHNTPSLWWPQKR